MTYINRTMQRASVPTMQEIATKWDEYQVLVGNSDLPADTKGIHLQHAEEFIEWLAGKNSYGICRISSNSESSD